MFPPTWTHIPRRAKPAAHVAHLTALAGRWAAKSVFKAGIKILGTRPSNAGKGRHQETKQGCRDVQDDTNIRKVINWGKERLIRQEEKKEKGFRSSKDESRLSQLPGQQKLLIIKSNFIPQAVPTASLSAAIHREALLYRVCPGTGQQWQL